MSQNEMIKRESESELFESIRHFSKYKALCFMEDKNKDMQKTETIQKLLIELFENNYKEVE